MSKHNILSGFLVVVVILTIAIATFLAVNYATGVLNAAVAFASTDQMAKLQACGVTPPAEFFKLKADIPNLILPAIYVGFPGLLICISILMFVAGYYYGDTREGRSSSETTTTTSSPNRNQGSGRYEAGSHSERVQTQRTTRSEGN